jgi:hypothetical protein
MIVKGIRSGVAVKYRSSPANDAVDDIVVGLVAGWFSVITVDARPDESVVPAPD